MIEKVIIPDNPHYLGVILKTSKGFSCSIYNREAGLVMETHTDSLPNAEKAANEWIEDKAPCLSREIHVEAVEDVLVVSDRLSRKAYVIDTYSNIEVITKLLSLGNNYLLKDVEGIHHIENSIFTWFIGLDQTVTQKEFVLSMYKNAYVEAREARTDHGIEKNYLLFLFGRSLKYTKADIQEDKLWNWAFKECMEQRRS